MKKEKVRWLLTEKKHKRVIGSIIDNITDALVDMDATATEVALESRRSSSMLKLYAIGVLLTIVLSCEHTKRLLIKRSTKNNLELLLSIIAYRPKERSSIRQQKKKVLYKLCGWFRFYK
jgi:hypothetical protein